MESVGGRRSAGLCRCVDPLSRVLALPWPSFPWVERRERCPCKDAGPQGMGKKQAQRDASCAVLIKKKKEVTIAPSPQSTDPWIYPTFLTSTFIK